MNNELLEKQINEARNSLSSEKLDMSFGEIMSMYERDELFISPPFQRLFRWSNEQQTKFIESLLIGIPIPPIFVAEIPETGQWEVVDGLQRISTMLSFFGQLRELPEKNNWTLSEGGLIKEFKEYDFKSLPLKYQLNIRRSVCRVEVIKWNSKIDMRYELFKRLNTLGSTLSEQELRNCIFRGYPSKFYDLLKRLAEQQDFVDLTDPAEEQKEQLYLEELVLRFFTLYDAAITDENKIKDNISDFMTNYMKEVVQNNSINFEQLENLFNRTVKLLIPLGKMIFRGGRGPFSPNIYDIVMIGLALHIDSYEKMNQEELADKIKSLKKHEEFKKVAGSGSSSKTRVAKRVEFLKKFFCI